MRREEPDVADARRLGSTASLAVKTCSRRVALPGRVGRRRAMIQLVLLIVAFLTLPMPTVNSDDDGTAADHDHSLPRVDASTGASAAAADATTGINSSADKVRLDAARGHMMPSVGLGVALTAEATYDAVRWALSAGYRLVDTAAEESYGNEDQVGRAVRDFAIASPTITREDVFVTTKLWDSDHGFYQTLEAFDESYEALNVGTVDLYLIHSPFGGRLVETWDAMLYLQARGYVKSIGVSNFGVEHLQAIEDSGRPLPTVNQIEMHPLVYRKRAPLIHWCRERNVQNQAYGSVMHGYPELLTADFLENMADRYQKTTAQILLRWALQHGFLVIPKSSRRVRILENVQLFDFTLSAADMATLDHWGDDIEEEERNIYKEDWNWNPIDEAPVHLGRTHYWADFSDLDYDDDYFDDDNEEEEEGGVNDEL